MKFLVIMMLLLVGGRVSGTAQESGQVPDSLALQWRNDAARGDREAGLRLGRALARNALPLELGSDKAWIQAAAEAGDGPACTWMGYAFKLGNPADPAQAVSWFQRGSQFGDPSAMHALGMMLHHGPLPTPRPTEGVSWLEKAATLGHVPSMSALGRYHMAGEGIPKDLPKAIKWLQLASEGGDASASNNLATLKFRGEGLPMDVQGAAELWEQAAQAGLPEACFNHANRHLDGVTRERDEAGAALWYEKAARGRHAPSAYNLGIMTIRGIQGQRDRLLGWAWLDIAARLGHPLAEGARDQAGLKFDDKQRARAEARSRLLQEDLGGLTNR